MARPGARRFQRIPSIIVHPRRTRTSCSWLNWSQFKKNETRGVYREHRRRRPGRRRCRERLTGSEARSRTTDAGRVRYDDVSRAPAPRERRGFDPATRTSGHRRAAASTSPSMAASPGESSPAATCHASTIGPRSPWPSTQMPSGSTSSRTTGSSDPTTAARPGVKWTQPTSVSGTDRRIQLRRLRRSRQSRRRLHVQHRLLQVHRWRGDLHRFQRCAGRRRSPNRLDRSHRRSAHPPRL